MNTEREIAEEAYYEELDRGRATCRECGHTDRVTDVQTCIECGNEVCEECSSEIYWELEACSEVCASRRAGKLVSQVRELRSQLSRCGLPERAANAGPSSPAVRFGSTS